jgi:large subunit ribosomal protein L7/L12
MAITREEVLEYLSGLDKPQLGMLIEELGHRWNVNTAIPLNSLPVPIYAAPIFVEDNFSGNCAVAYACAPPEEYQTEFDVILESFPLEKKIALVKAIRDLNHGMGLKEAKEIVESAYYAPKVIKSGISKADAVDIERALRDAGGKASIK